jgi:hypothetical protein
MYGKEGIYFLRTSAKIASTIGRTEAQVSPTGIFDISDNGNSERRNILSLSDLWIPLRLGRGYFPNCSPQTWNGSGKCLWW